MKQAFFYLLFLLCSPAFAVPEKTLIEVKYHPGEIYYFHNKTEIPCGEKKEGSVVLGCASSKKSMNIKINVAQRHIIVDVFSDYNEIEIHADLPKDSCQYKEVLKHELTHLDLHSGSLGNIVDEGMENIVDAFNVHFKQKDYQGAVQAAQQKFQEFVQKYYEEDNRLNQDFDRDDVNTIVRACQIPPNVKIVYDPPEIEYSSEAWINCPYRDGYCLQTSSDYCDKLSFLSCMDFDLKSFFSIKLYLGEIFLNIDVPYFKIKILDDYLPGSCEYETLADYEFSLVDSIERAIYDVVDNVKKELVNAYNSALKSQYGTVDLSREVELILQNYIDTMNANIKDIISHAKTITLEELRKKCAK